MKKTVALFSLLFLLLHVLLWASPPVPYSGKVAINGVNYSGQGNFSFTIRDQAGAVHWRNGATANDTIRVNVANGRYVVLLGGQRMNPLPASLFANHDELYVKVSFDNNDGQGLRHLTPDQRVTAVPYAKVAEVAKVANTVKSASVTKDMLSSELVAELSGGGGKLGTSGNAAIEGGVVVAVPLGINPPRGSRPIERNILSRITIQPQGNPTTTYTSYGYQSAVGLSNNLILVRGDYLYSFGGYYQIGSQIPHPVSDIHRKNLKNQANQSWEKIGNLPYPIYNLSGLIIDGVAYLVGGRGSYNEGARSYRSGNNDSNLPSDKMISLNLEDLEVIGNYTLPDNLTFENVTFENRTLFKTKSGLGFASESLRDHKNQGAYTSGNAYEFSVSTEGWSFHNKTVGLGLANAFYQFYDSKHYWFEIVDGISIYRSDSIMEEREFLFRIPYQWNAHKIYIHQNNVFSLIRIENNELEIRKLAHLNGEIYVTDYDQFVSLNGPASKDLIFGEIQKIDQSNLYAGSPNAFLLNLNEIFKGKYDLFVTQGSPSAHNSGSTGGGLPVSGSITKEMLSADLASELSKPITLSMLPIDVQNDLNRTITGNMLSSNLRSDMNSTIGISRLSQDVVTKLNQGGTVSDGSITYEKIANNTINVGQLNDQILKYLKPEITLQPQSQTVLSESNFSISVETDGRYLSYQWKKNGVGLTGETNSTIHFVDANASLHEGNYTVSISNDFGVVESNSAELLVKASRFIVSPLNLELIWVQPGSFTMGSPSSETGRDSDENQTAVTITKGYFLGKFEVTQRQYELVMTGNDAGYDAKPTDSNSSGLGLTDLTEGPVFNVDYSSVTKFIEILNGTNVYNANLPQGFQFALPTEAEWEYACRAGTATAFNIGNEIPGASVYGGTSTSTSPNDANVMNRQSISEVGSYISNAWGFHDMHGNVWEFTADWYSTYPQGVLVDPNGPQTGVKKVMRGGSTNNWSSLARSANRQEISINAKHYFPSGPGARHGRIGFRIALKQSN